MTYYNHNSERNYNRQSQRTTTPDYPYMSWLTYKRLHHIVKYYPTENMYITYKWWCLAHQYTPFGAEIQDTEKATALLVVALRNRLGKQSRLLFCSLVRFMFCHLGNRKGCTRCQNLPQLNAVTYCPSEVAPLRCEWQGLYFNFQLFCDFFNYIVCF